MPSPEDGPRSFQITRRDGLLLGIGGAGLVASGALRVDTLLAQTVEPTKVPPAFVTVSRFVTTADLDDDIANARAWTQLCALDTGFAQSVERLGSAIRQSGTGTMAQWLAVKPDAALLATARTITSAFYLGYTGDPDSQPPHDTSGFVTFTGALMWRPTIDATVIPTYARGRTDFWVQPPAGTPVPKGAPGIAAWTSASTPSDKKA